MQRRLFSFVLIVHAVVSYKFLAFSPQFAVSHVNFIAKISDTLVDAGHEVVIVAPRVHPSISGALAKKARVIELPENEYTKRWHAAERQALDNYWNSSGIAFALEASRIFDDILKASNETVNHPGLIEQLRAENFDAAFSENPVGFGLFHLAGIEKTALAVSIASMEFSYDFTQMPSNPAYVPSSFSGYGDRMTFVQRVLNFFYSIGFGMLISANANWIQPVFEDKLKGIHLSEIIANNSLVLLNSEPLLDYPRPTVHRVIDVGGIATATKIDPLDDYWSEVLDRRNRTVIVSFGSYIRASKMPDAYKETIRNTLAKFCDVTFVLKYESPEHNISQGISNIIEATWMPQLSLLNDPRLTAFITHGGQGSTMEAVYAGIPMLTVPTQGDQFRNAAMLKRAGLGDIVHLNELESGDTFEKAIRKLLENEEYANNAREMAVMLKNRPFSAKEKVVRNMEFLAQYGPLRILDHEGRNQNFVQFYLIDVFLFLIFVTILLLGLIALCCVASCRCCCNTVRRKYFALKQE